MTTKEEVLRLAEENCYMVHNRAVHIVYEFDVNQLTKIIELAKAQGAEEERNKLEKNIKILNEIQTIMPDFSDFSQKL